MNKKTIISLVALFIVLIIIITFLEFVTKSISKMREDNNRVNIYTPQYISEEQKNNEKRFDSEVEEVLNLFKTRNYEEIYSKFSDIYKAAKYPTIDDFINEMNELIKDDTTIELSEKVNHSRGYYATLNLNDDDVLYIYVDNLSTDEISIKLDRIYEIDAINMPDVASNEVIITFDYCLRYINKEGYIINVKNNLNVPIEFSLTGSYLYNTRKPNQNTYDVLDEMHTTIPARGEKRIEMQYAVPYSLMFRPDILNFNYTVNGSTYNKLINVDFTKEIGED